MRKFSDIPEFILDEYLDAVLSTYTKPASTSSLFWDKVLFTDWNDVKFKNSGNVKWNLVYSFYDKSEFSQSYLVGPESCIVTKGGKKLNVYVETDEEFEEIGIKPKTNYKTENENWVGSYYNFDIYDSIYPIPTNTVSYELTGSDFKFIQYDCFSTEKYKTVDTRSGFDVYFRNDNPFFEWGKNNYSEYANFSKDFLFLGKIFPYKNLEWSCRIFRYLLKDFVINALPPNNRNERLTEFLKVAFDNIYSKIYFKNKNIKTLYDSQEIDLNHITNLADFYNVNIEDYEYKKETRLRNLIENIPIALKKKGTYTSIIGIWNFVTGFEDELQKRDINIYEWWHDTLEDGTFSLPLSSDSWKEINYLNSYSFPATASGSFATSATSGIDFTGCSGDVYYSRYTNSYPDFYSSNIEGIVANSYIHKQLDPAKTWNITHWINSNELLIQCFNSDYEEIYPVSVTINDGGKCTVSFNKETTGYCALCKVNYEEAKTGRYWSIDHYINKKLVLSQTFNKFNEKFSPMNIYTSSYDTAVIKTYDRTEGSGYFLDGDYIFYNLNAEETGSKVWTINHNLYSLLITQVYDINDNLIIPKSIKQNDLLTTTIEFSKPTNGYVVFKEIGQVNFVETKEGSILSPHYKVEGDLTCKPVDSDAIFSKETAKNLLDNFEMVRPVNRVAHYHLVFSPLTYFSGSIISTYKKQFEPYWLSASLYSRFLENVSIHSQSLTTSEWDVTHDLRSIDVVVVCYDENYNQIYPADIELTSWAGVKLRFETPQKGYAVLVANSEYSTFLFDSDTTITHNFGRKAISQFYTLDNLGVIFPPQIINNENSVFVEKSEEGNAYLVEGDLLWTQTTPSESWKIPHNFGTTGIISQFFDEDWERIIPESLTLTNSDTCVVNFSEPISGYGIIKSVGFVDYQKDVSNDFSNNGIIVVLGNGTDKNYINQSITDVQSEIAVKRIYNTAEKNFIYTVNDNLYIDIELDKYEELDIREIGIFDGEREKMYFYSQGSQLYKYPGYTMTIHFRVLKE